MLRKRLTRSLLGEKHFQACMDPSFWTCLSHKRVECSSASRKQPGRQFLHHAGASVNYKLPDVCDLIDIMVEFKEGMYIGCAPVGDSAIPVLPGWCHTPSTYGTMNGLQALLYDKGYAAWERYWQSHPFRNHPIHRVFLANNTIYVTSTMSHQLCYINYVTQFIVLHAIDCWMSSITGRHLTTLLLVYQ